MKRTIILCLSTVFLLTSCSPAISETDTKAPETDLTVNVQYSHDYALDSLQSETFHGVTYNVPDNWKKTPSKDNPEVIYYYPNGNTTSMLMVAFDPEGTQYISNPTDSSNYFDGFFSNFSEYEERDRHTSTIDNISEGVASSFIANMNENNTTDGDLVVFPSDGGLLTFVIGDVIPYEYDHSKDFYEIVKSIRFISQDSLTPPETTVSEETIENTSAMPESKTARVQETEAAITDNSNAQLYKDITNNEYYDMLVYYNSLFMDELSVTESTSDLANLISSNTSISTLSDEITNVLRELDASENTLKNYYSELDKNRDQAPYGTKIMSLLINAQSCLRQYTMALEHLQDYIYSSDQEDLDDYFKYIEKCNESLDSYNSILNSELSALGK